MSLSSSFSKIFKKIIYKRLMDHLLRNKFLANSQFGFMKNSSTINANL
ncbi:MAG: hypothetical protein LBD41_02105 [Clostridiales Family XIII bacterium]|nr:hypothetical protein [Clostridiales Family XIII bacterium]